MNKKIKSMVRDIASSIAYRIFVFCHHFHIMTAEETIQTIINDGLSAARFGDGEFKWILNVKQESFQESNTILSRRLKEIINAKAENCIICIPRPISSDNEYSQMVKRFWRNFVRKYGWKIGKILSNKRIYGDANFTRWYRAKNLKKADYRHIVEQLKQIWDKRDIVVIEGELTRFGVGNDLLSNAKSVKRIIAPARNAFSYYDEILKFAKNSCQDKLVLAALGPTATVLAYDLSRENIQTIDVGHLDIEYEWFLRSAHETKIGIPGKYVNEAGGFGEEMKDAAILKEYRRQIIARMGT